MKKTLSIFAVALMMAGSTAFACGGCGCEAKKADKEKSECSACDKKKADQKAEKKETAYNTQTEAQQLACSGHDHKKDKDKEVDKTA